MLAERKKIVPILSYKDINDGATNVGDSINMRNFHRCTFLVLYQDLATQAHSVKVYSGATDGAVTSALTFRYAFGGAAAGSANCDKLEAWATSAALTVAHTYDNYLLVIDIKAEEMDMANNEEWLTISFDDDIVAGATGHVSVLAVLEPRFTGNRSASALA